MSKVCSLVLYDMYNKSISARESNVDLATGTSERKSLLRVIAFAAAASKCSRQCSILTCIGPIGNHLVYFVMIGPYVGCGRSIQVTFVGSVLCVVCLWFRMGCSSSSSSSASSAPTMTSVCLFDAKRDLVRYPIGLIRSDSGLTSDAAALFK